MLDISFLSAGIHIHMYVMFISGCLYDKKSENDQKLQLVKIVVLFSSIFSAIFLRRAKAGFISTDFDLLSWIASHCQSCSGCQQASFDLEKDHGTASKRLHKPSYLLAVRVCVGHHQRPAFLGKRVCVRDR